jgi:hypothetical protein
VGTSIQDAWNSSLASVHTALGADPADDRAMLLRATSQEIASTRDGLLDAVTQRLDLPQKSAAEAYSLAEQHERNPRSVWGYGPTQSTSRSSGAFDGRVEPLAKSRSSCLRCCSTTRATLGRGIGGDSR